MGNVSVLAHFLFDGGDASQARARGLAGRLQYYPDRESSKCPRGKCVTGTSLKFRSVILRLTGCDSPARNVDWSVFGNLGTWSRSSDQGEFRLWVT